MLSAIGEAIARVELQVIICHPKHEFDTGREYYNLSTKRGRVSDDGHTLEPYP